MEWLLMVLVFGGTIPMLVSCGQFLLVGLHGLRSPYAHCRQFAPRGLPCQFQALRIRAGAASEQEQQRYDQSITQRVEVA